MLWVRVGSARGSNILSSNNDLRGTGDMPLILGRATWCDIAIILLVFPDTSEGISSTLNDHVLNRGEGVGWR